MRSLVFAENWGGWSKIMKELRERKETWPFCSAWYHAEHALSVVHELCRDRSGCEAVASDTEFLKKLAAFPSRKCSSSKASSF
mmetsp:Transcript_13075/g.39517  ORF Transcript_13075/g.39517 Transcript_13075/m.39517 type:complete len:83 (-) Transcript_13075:295-543(-)